MPATYYGGAAENPYRLCLGVARLGCEVRVLTTDANGPRRTVPIEHGRDVLFAAGFEVLYAHRIMRGSAAPGLLTRLVPEVRRADVVHLTGFDPPTALPTLAACRILGRPLVWSPRGALQRWRGGSVRFAPRVIPLLGRWLAPRRIAIHAVTPEEFAVCAARMPAGAAITIPNGVRIPAEPRHEPGDGRLRIGFAGRIEPRKALENLIDAGAILRDAGLEFSLAIVGEGEKRYLRALRKRIARRGLDEAIAIAGALHGAARRRFFERIDLFVLPSHLENFGTATTEALARGVPVIAGRGTPWRRLDERGCGFWVDNDPAVLADAIRRIATMPLAAMGARGRAWMREEFDWAAASRQMRNLYTALIHGVPLPSPALDASGAAASAAAD